MSSLRRGPFAIVVLVAVVSALFSAVPAGDAPPHVLGRAGGDGSSSGSGAVAHSVARVWNEALLDAIRTDRPKPPVHARNLFHLSVAMWDAWAAYDPAALGYFTQEKLTALDVAAARREAISHAAYRLLVHRFQGGGISFDGQPCQPGSAESLQRFDDTMAALGYDPAVTTTVGDAPAALGNRIGAEVIANSIGDTDGAYEGGDLCYPDPSGFFPYNPPLIWSRPGTSGLFYPNLWQPLAFDFLVLQNGIIIGAALQSFVGVDWGDVTPFAVGPEDIPPPPATQDCLTYPGSLAPYFDPGCPPQLGGERHAEVAESVVELIEFGSYADPADETLIDISPAVYGNAPLGTDENLGHPLNPATCEPYPPNVVRRFDFARVMAEFWADGPNSETPPGHWNTLANYVSDHPELGPKRIGGLGEPVDDLEWDVKLYLALNGAVHDAAIAAWSAKHHYNSSRPITLVRHMAELGQSTDPAALRYDPDGLPLIPGLIEQITEETTAPGGKHEHLAAHCDLGFNHGLPCQSDDDCPDDGPFDGQCISSIGETAIRGWLRTPEDPETQVGGVAWIRSLDWQPYQKQTFVTPPFPGYTSGHSTFSRAAAEVMAKFTGSPFFPGGVGTFVAHRDEYLEFELGPSETVVLEWATYADAADQAGISRRYGGIHPIYDDLPGREMGFGIGLTAFEKALEHYNTPYDPLAVPDPFEGCSATGGDDDSSDDDSSSEDDDSSSEDDASSDDGSSDDDESSDDDSSSSDDDGQRASGRFERDRSARTPEATDGAGRRGVERRRLEQRRDD